MALLDHLPGIVVVSILLFAYYARKRSRLPYAPGPKGYPIIGNLFDLPRHHEWIKFTEWANEYRSGIINVRVLGTNMVILNSLKVANELLDKRSAIYSSRPQFTMTNELMGWKFLFASMPYNDEWKKRRRLFQQAFPMAKPNLFQPQQLNYLRRILPQLIDGKRNYKDVLRHYAGGISLNMAYGISIQPENDPFINLAENAVKLLIDNITPGKWLVDAIPWLKYVPEWFPGAEFKRKAKEWHKVTMEFRESPYQYTMRALANGQAGPSFIVTCLENNIAGNKEEKEEIDELIKDTASMFFVGGTDTIMSIVFSFMLMLLVHPETQKKAQEELDRVVGQDRLPDFSDLPNLPYLGALLRESLRWHSPTPLSLQHTSTEDDVYEGYFIPKNSIMIPNVWAMMHDERNYSEAFKFSPERFLTEDGNALDSNVLDPLDVIFGFGRRVCPGRYIAESIIYIVIASMLSTMNISKAVDSEGKAIEPKLEWNATIVPAPVPFECVIKPRSKKAEDLVHAESLNAMSESY